MYTAQYSGFVCIPPETLSLAHFLSGAALAHPKLCKDILCQRFVFVNECLSRRQSVQGSSGVFLERVCVGSGRVERHSSQSLCSVDQVAGLLDYALLRRD